MVLGGLLSSTGLILSSFATSLEHLYISMGFLSGLLTVMLNVSVLIPHLVNVEIKTIMTADKIRVKRNEIDENLHAVIL